MLVQPRFNLRQNKKNVRLVPEGQPVRLQSFDFAQSINTKQCFMNHEAKRDDVSSLYTNSTITKRPDECAVCSCNVLNLLLFAN